MDTKNDTGEMKNKMLSGMAGSEDGESEEITEEDFAIKEKQDQIEADILKMKFLGEDEVPKKAKKKKREKPQKKLTPEEEALKDVEAIQEVYEILRIDKIKSVVKKIVVNLTIFVCLFAAAGYLQYIYSSEGGILANVRKHEHDYTVLGRRVDGDCQHLGYTVYICNYPYCRAETNIVDEKFGNHKYREQPEIVINEDTKDKYEVYECSVCGEKNRVHLGKVE